MDNIVLFIVFMTFVWDGIYTRIQYMRLDRVREQWKAHLLDIDQIAIAAAFSGEYQKGKVMAHKLTKAFRDKHHKVVTTFLVGSPQEVDNRYATTFKKTVGG